MIYRQLRIVTIIMVFAVVLSCIGVALMRKFVFAPPEHGQEAAIRLLSQDTISASRFNYAPHVEESPFTGAF
jgi:hypothetical protein